VDCICLCRHGHNFIIQRYGSRMRYFHIEDFITKYGFMYAKYKASSWYWECVIFTKRLVIVGGITVFSRTPLFSLIFIDFAILVNLMFHASKNPFTAKHENRAETCNLCIQFVVCTCLIVLCLNQYLYSDISKSTYYTVYNSASALGVVGIIVGFCAMVAVVAKDQ
jgi:hypothetical protein